MKWPFSFEQTTLLLSTVTALVAIIGPVFQSIYAARSAVKLKRMELYSPQLLSALALMSEKFMNLQRSDVPPDPKVILGPDYHRCHLSFISACHGVLVLVHRKSLRRRIVKLLDAIADNGGQTDAKLLNDFTLLMNDLSRITRP